MIGPARNLARDTGRTAHLAGRCLALLAAALVAHASPARAQQRPAAASPAACIGEASPSLVCRPTAARWAGPRTPRPSPSSSVPIVAGTLADGLSHGGPPTLPDAATTALAPPVPADTSRASDGLVFLGALVGMAVVGIPAALIGHGIDRDLHDDEPSEDPGLVGAYSGLFLGAGAGGVLGAHIGSGGRGSPWIPLGIVGAGIPLMALSLELGALTSATGVVVAVAAELGTGGVP